MSNISVSQFTDAVVQWAGKRDDSFRYYWPVAGGWEGWIQVDLTAYILSVDSTIEILREQPIYTNSRKKTDLLLNTDLSTKRQIPVEIKAQSFQNRTKFVKGVKDDLAKLNDERNDNYDESTCVMLAMPFEQEALKKTLNIEMDDHKIFNVVYQGEVACVMAVWTEDDGWLNAGG